MHHPPRADFNDPATRKQVMLDEGLPQTADPPNRRGGTIAAQHNKKPTPM
jgi:hypothetical protein